MIEKTKNCIYCGIEMESITAKKKFCCDLHRVYYNREQKNIKILGFTITNKDPVIREEIVKYLVQTSVNPMPQKEPGEDSFDFAARKNEWKKKYGI